MILDSGLLFWVTMYTCCIAPYASLWLGIFGEQLYTRNVQL